MTSGSGDRAVSEVIGVILVFAFLVVAFTIYQGLVVPEQNRQVEFEHNQAVHGDIQDLRNAILTTAATGTGQSVSIDMGATYPRRALAQNLGYSAGGVRTDPVGSMRIENARALDSETADYLGGGPVTFETVSIHYRPVYSFYSTAPETIYENSVVFNRFAEANITLTDQGVVDGRRITLVAVNGSLDAGRQGTLSVSPEALSASTTQVAVENTTGERVNLTLPTHLSAATWQEILADEMDGGGYVDAVEPVPGERAVTIVLQGNTTYDLRLAKVGVGSGTAEEGPSYITDVEGDGASVPEGGSQQLVVEVRDRFNNPVSNVTVSLGNSPGFGSVSPTERTTDSEGRATFTYTAVSDVGQLESDVVQIEFDDGSPTNEVVTFDLEVLDSDGSGGGGDGGDTDEINPGSSGEVILVDAVEQSKDLAEITFNNTRSSAVTVASARISFYYVDNTGVYPNSFTFNGSVTMQVGDQFNDAATARLQPGEDTIEISFEPSNNMQVDGDFFILSVRYNEFSGTSTYFVAVQP